MFRQRIGSVGVEYSIEDFDPNRHIIAMFQKEWLRYWIDSRDKYNDPVARYSSPID